MTAQPASCCSSLRSTRAADVVREMLAARRRHRRRHRAVGHRRSTTSACGRASCATARSASASRTSTAGGTARARPDDRSRPARARSTSAARQLGDAAARGAGAPVQPAGAARRSRCGQRHYDIGNDLYEAMLDRRMVYTCALLAATRDTLDEAQEAKLELVCRKLGLRPGMRVLDLGCGWGGFAAFAAERYGVDGRRLHRVARAGGVGARALRPPADRHPPRRLPQRDRHATTRSSRSGSWSTSGRRTTARYMELVDRAASRPAASRSCTRSAATGRAHAHRSVVRQVHLPQRGVCRRSASWSTAMEEHPGPRGRPQHRRALRPRR